MRDDPTPLAEWVMGALGAFIFVSLVSVTTWCAVVGGDQPPIVSAQVSEITAANGVYIVEIEARNLGDTTAADAEIVAELHLGGEVIETHSIMFDYVPRHSERRGGFVFARDPREGQIALRTEGYADP